jgi:hypothetical protein
MRRVNRTAMPILIRNPDGPYYSAGDERAFWEWLKRIPCVVRMRGSGPELRIHIRRRRISDRCLGELLALFRRYDIEMSQLAQFESSSNRRWFRNPSAAWYPLVFGRPSATGRQRRGRRPSSGAGERTGQ